jgi:predicted AAA+ superfamily ATPase
MFNLDNFLRQNPWRLERKALDFYYLPRQCYTDLIYHLQDNKPLLIKGPRGAGKTTVLKILIKHLINEIKVPSERIFYFDLDDALTRNFFQSTSEVINFIKGFAPQGETNHNYFIIDEIQHLTTAISNPLEFLKELAGQFNGKIIMTSSLNNFAPDMNDLVQSELSLFNYKEYLNRMLNAENIYLPEFKEYSADILKRIMQGGFPKILLPHLDEYLVYGGYPLVVREYKAKEKSELLRRVFQDVTNEMLSFAGGINQPDKFSRLIQILAKENGLLHNISTLAKNAGLDRVTIEHYRRILVSNYLISSVYPYHEEGGQSGIPIIYFCDTGLRNLLLSLFHELDLRPDRDILLNNFLYRELTGISNDIGFIKMKQTERLAFVFKHNNRFNLACVLYDFPDKKSGHRGLMGMVQKIKPNKVIILTKEHYEYKTENEITFIYLPAAMAWLLPELFELSN